jgi:hypothetical protein
MITSEVKTKVKYRYEGEIIEQYCRTNFNKVITTLALTPDYMHFGQKETIQRHQKRRKNRQKRAFQKKQIYHFQSRSLKNARKKLCLVFLKIKMNLQHPDDIFTTKIEQKQERLQKSSKRVE